MEKEELELLKIKVSELESDVHRLCLIALANDNAFLQLLADKRIATVQEMDEYIEAFSDHYKKISRDEEFIRLMSQVRDKKGG